ncbi:CLUMA_CG016919, isoform A [Clunio marinus]|uniref:CLUMA_CG016919, isoform A n=1 Tax=Clunio marinus TaxID=568069 RepID=A0A1J1IS61_9DIPT|nr:CLUMA_CG016919, isoform A [Clunio marinus]
MHKQVDTKIFTCSFVWCKNLLADLRNDQSFECLGVYVTITFKSLKSNEIICRKISQQGNSNTLNTH